MDKSKGQIKHYNNNFDIQAITMSQDDWVDLLPLADFTYNNTYH